MKLQASSGGRQTIVDLQHEGPGVRATLDDRYYELEIRELNRNQLLLLYNGKVFDCRLEAHSGLESLDVFVDTQRHAVTLADPKRLRGAFSASVHGHEAAHIVAPMPGKVVRLLAEIGATVHAGQGIVTVEAMKMQNEMKSPKDGTIVALNVQLGATVNAGDVLAVIE